MPRSFGDIGVLILLCGLPGSGKSTLANRLEKEREAVRICPDDWCVRLLHHPCTQAQWNWMHDQVEIIQWDLALDLLRKGLTVILENGFWAAEERDQYAMEALEVGASIELHYLECPDIEHLCSRIERRNSDPANAMPIDKEDLVEWWSQFQPPTEEELAFYDVGCVIPWS